MTRFRWILAAALAAVLLGTLLAYLLNPPAKLPTQEDVSGILHDQDGRPYVRGLTYTQVKDGAKRWTLSAEGARYDESSGHVSLIRVKVDYFPSRGGLLTIVGDEGEYDQHNQVVNLKGHVRGHTQDGITLVTDHLTYNEQDQLVETDAEVTIAGARFKVTGKGMVALVSQGTLAFKSQVDTTFIPAGKGPPPGVTVDDNEPDSAEGGKQ